MMLKSFMMTFGEKNSQVPLKTMVEASGTMLGQNVRLEKIGNL